MTDRRLPRWRELRPLLRMEPPSLHRTQARLDRAPTIADLRAVARRRVPRSVFDYVDGAAGAELALARARRAFARIEFTPRVLRDVSDVDTATSILGAPSALPLILAPTGFTRMMHYEGEPAVARVAGQAGVPYALSTLGTTGPDDLAAAAPATDLWFQLYVWKDRSATADLIDQVRASGYRALILTVDSPVGGPRLRDVRNGMTVPPALTVRTLADLGRRPRWWANLITTEPLSFASLSNWDGTVAELMSRALDPTMTFDGLDWLRDRWSGPLVVKGVQTPEDAAAVVDHGADAVVISNHGGRQLDRAAVPLEQLPAVLDAVGDRAEVYIDGGIMDGADVVAAVAFGARACLVGRAYLYGLMAGGQAGVQRAVDILTTQIRTTMQLCGATRVAELTPDLVRLRAN